MIEVHDNTPSCKVCGYAPHVNRCEPDAQPPICRNPLGGKTTAPAIDMGASRFLRVPVEPPLPRPVAIRLSDAQTIEVHTVSVNPVSIVLRRPPPPTACPTCDGPLLDLRGAGFNPVSMARDGQCVLVSDTDYTCARAQAERDRR